MNMPPKTQGHLRQCFDSLHSSLTAIGALVEEYGDEEAKLLFSGAEFYATNYISRLREKFDVPFYPKKEGMK